MRKSNPCRDAAGLAAGLLAAGVLAYAIYAGAAKPAAAPPAPPPAAAPADDGLPFVPCLPVWPQPRGEPR